MDGKAFLAYLLKNQYLDKVQLQQCLKESAQSKIPVLKLLVQNGYILSDTFKLALAEFKKSQSDTFILPQQKQGMDLFEETLKPTLPESETLPLTENEKNSFPARKKFGKYELLEELARGGMGVVYKARHTELGQIYALKVILSGHFASKEDVKRFYQEAKLTAKIKHPNIVQVIDSGEEGGQHYLAMEFIEGKNLKQLIAEENWSIRKMLHLFRKILDGLSEAHKQGIIHRDLKPANIFVTPDGEPKIGDFGLAKESTLARESQRLTKTGEILGTPSYMPPEQASGEISALDARTYIYAIGACLYEALTQRCPFEGKTLHELFYKIISEEAKPLSQINKKIHPDMDTMVLKALEKDKSRRYESAKAFEEDIERFLEGYPILAKPLSRREHFYKWLKRNRKMAVMVLVTMFLSIGGSVYWQHLHYQKKLKQHQERLKYWKIELKSSENEPRMQVNALFEIAKMQEEEICDELLSILEEGKAYFLVDTKTSNQEEYYKTMVDALGRIGNHRAVHPLMEAIEEFSDREKQNRSASVGELHYLIALFDALANIQQKESLPFLEKIRKKMGERSQFWIRTSWTYKNLLNQEEIRSDSLSSAQEYYDRAKKKQEKGDFKEAIFDYTQAITLNPKHAEAYKNRGNIKLVQKDFEGALQDYIQALSINPQFVEAYNNRGLIKQLQKDFEGAISDFTQALSINPQFVEAYNNRGNIKQLQKDFEGAISDFTQVLSINPQFVEAYNNRGNVKYLQKDLDGAIADYTQALLINPQMLNAYFFRGDVKQAQKDFEGAIQDYTQAINLNPQFTIAYNNRGIAKQAKGDIKGAFLDYNQAIKTDSQYSNAYLNRGILNEFQQDWENALLDLNQAIILNPQLTKAYYHRGYIKQLKEDWNGAILDYTQAIALDSNYIQALYNRGICLLQKRIPLERKKARQDFQEFLKLVQGDNSLQMQQGRNYIFQQFPDLKLEFKK